MKITVFGGSQPKEGDAAYAEAQDLGRLLAERGHTVLTGGYIGTMEAVSRGACEAGGHVIGVTCEDIEAWRPIKANAWVKEEIRKKTLIERLHALIHDSDAALALPGGAGTLAEISLMWNLMIVETLRRR
ncbi:MAG TPA: LOG family protein, partial [Anaerolineales bacterium]|nr:LOG family protein [Anaerolineales bacterium]